MMHGEEHLDMLAKESNIDPVICDGDLNVEDVHFPLDSPDGVDPRRWSIFVSPTAYLESLSQSTHRLRHAFPPSLPDAPGRSPTLPLYFPDHGSQPTSTAQAGQYKYPLVGTHYLKSVSNPPVSPSRLLLFWNSRSAWLLLYFVFNLLLTLSNKSVLTDFPFPYTLTALHALFSTMGGTWLRWRGVYQSKRLSSHDELVLIGFSILYAVNIAMLVPFNRLIIVVSLMQFHQVVRAVTPVFTIALSRVFYGPHLDKRKLLPLVPVILGVALATYGDYYCTAWGFFLTLFGTFLAALKTIYTNVLQSPQRPGRISLSKAPSFDPLYHRRAYLDVSNPLSGDSILASILKSILPPRLDLHPLDLLTRMSPLAFVQCVLYAHLSGELDLVRRFSTEGFFPPPSYNGTLPDAPYIHETYTRHMDLSKLLVLLINGCIAFGLNVVSFSANGKVGALSMTVAANVKQVLTILFAVSLFDLTITPTNAAGITITLLGGAWYACEEYTAKAREARKATS
ncbi:hypothetical protein NM688_g4933 [Phlebia brevispora]|uniref:Uncharacterized protein n=1 Tax=Phlebia brevispora TaxID=194682 RepID=A0ACC1T1Q4_9APHY|nr:hypothetical protein NM688_g4933 [Phlebia brevispora]